jgi:mannose-1-phosphate guanylyltransferase
MKKTSPPLIALVLCGGSGSRLWPLSREALPKPFVAVANADANGGTMLEGTYRRLACAPKSIAPAAVITVCAAAHDFLCAAAYRDAGFAARHLIIREPCARNTAAAVAAGVCAAQKRFGESCLILALPADHIVGDVKKFWRYAALAKRAAEDGYLALLGIAPDRPSSAYGYIARGKPIGGGVFRAAKFVEKPDAKRAARYLRQGYLWNAGIFCFTAVAMEKMMTRYAPAVAAAANAASRGDSGDDKEKIALERRAYARAPSLSLDYAVAEKTDLAAVIPADKHLGWSDAGALDAFIKAAHPQTDSDGNRAPATAILKDCRGVSVIGDNKRVIAAAGLRDIVVADSPDALFVAAVNSAARSGEVFSILQKRKHPAAADAPTTPRPWGAYTVLAEGRGWKVKRIEVAPGAVLSLQSHARRSEHWTAVEGVMTVVINRRRLRLKTNQSCFIPQGAKHRMANDTRRPAAVIEVQVGDYLGEDDITRYEDIYGRA